MCKEFWFRIARNDDDVIIFLRDVIVDFFDVVAFLLSSFVTLHACQYHYFFKYMISLNQCYKSTKSVRNTKLNRSYMQIIFNDIFCLHFQICEISQMKPPKIIESTDQDSAKQFR